MYLQGGLDSIPEFVEFHYEDEFGVVSAKPRPGIGYGYTWEKMLDYFLLLILSQARIRRVRSTFSSHCPLSSNQRG